MKKTNTSPGKARSSSTISKDAGRPSSSRTISKDAGRPRTIFSDAGRSSSSRTISIIGSGNVATHLALALRAAGHTIHQVLSRSYDHARLLAMRVDAQAIDSWRALDEGADVYLIAVTDNSIYDLALDLHLTGSIVLHTSGTTPASVLRNISRRYGVVWSPQTFVRDIAMDYRHLPLCIEGSDAETESSIAELFASVSDNIHHLAYEQRRCAHLAAVMVSNFVGAINATAQQYMHDNGLDFNMLRPLAEQTLRKWDYGDLWSQLTGPAIRRDDSTLAAQRRLLADNPDLLKLYDLMTELIQKH